MRLTKRQKIELDLFFRDRAGDEDVRELARELSRVLIRQRKKARDLKASAYFRYNASLNSGLERRVSDRVAFYQFDPPLRGIHTFDGIRTLKPDSNGDPHLLRVLHKEPAPKPPGNPDWGPPVDVSAKEVERLQTGLLKRTMNSDTSFSETAHTLTFIPTSLTTDIAIELESRVGRRLSHSWVAKRLKATEFRLLIDYYHRIK